MRSLRRKRTKPEDWMTGTFHLYAISDVVGAGTFGQVTQRGRIRHNLYSFQHCYTQEDGDGKGFPVTAMREMRILRQMEHKNIVDLLEVVIDGNPTPGRLSTVALVFEYLDHDLSGLLDTPEAANQITPALAKSFMMQLVEGVAYMHSKNIIHRDIKGANLLISNHGHLKIADWGLARRLYEMQDKYTTKVITLWYRPPELLLKTALYGPAVDMWSVGCIVAELLTRGAAFPGKSESDQLSLIFDTCGTPTSQNWPGWKELPDAGHWRDSVRKNPRSSKMQERFSEYGAVALELLMSLLALDPRKRFTAPEALQHHFFEVKPLPTIPGTVTLNLDSCHEFEAKNRKKEGKKGGKGSHHSSEGNSKIKDTRLPSAAKAHPQSGVSTQHHQQHGPAGIQISLPVSQPGQQPHSQPHHTHAHHPMNNLVIHSTSSGRSPQPVPRQLVSHQQPPSGGRGGSQNWGR
ncbi:unnamed protein product [Ascophyllum nodosum]